VLPEELGIWVIIFVALLVVGAIIRRGEAMPKIERSAHENRPDYRNFDERAWLTKNRYGHDEGDHPTGSLSQASVDVGAATERSSPLKAEAPEGSTEGAADAAVVPRARNPDVPDR
jgi:hypothetical protein